MRNLIAFVICGTLLLHFTLAAQKESDSHHITWGARSSRDVLLTRQILTEKAKALRIVSDDYEYRQKTDPYKRTITQIVVTDQYTNGNGGHATLKNGGPSTDFAIIHLKSQRGHGFNFIIDIYGQ